MSDKDYDLMLVMPARDLGSELSKLPAFLAACLPLLSKLISEVRQMKVFIALLVYGILDNIYIYRRIILDNIGFAAPLGLNGFRFGRELPDPNRLSCRHFRSAAKCRGRLEANVETNCFCRAQQPRNRREARGTYIQRLQGALTFKDCNSASVCLL